MTTNSQNNVNRQKVKTSTRKDIEVSRQMLCKQSPSRKYLPKVTSTTFCVNKFIGYSYSGVPYGLVIQATDLRFDYTMRSHGLVVDNWLLDHFGSGGSRFKSWLHLVNVESLGKALHIHFLNSSLHSYVKHWVPDEQYARKTRHLYNDSSSVCSPESWKRYSNWKRPIEDTV